MGSVGGPVGAIIGGLAGFGLGTLGGYLNQDELVETAARASVIAEKANQRYQGTDQIFGGAGTWLKQYLPRLLWFFRRRSSVRSPGRIRAIS